MVGWPWSRASEGGVHGQLRENMDLENSAIEDLPHVEKKVLAAGRDACYKVWLRLISRLVVFVSLGYWYEGCILYVLYSCQVLM